MAAKLHSHKVVINDRRRENKRTSDILRKGTPKRALHQVFNAYYKDQLRALYRAVCRDK